MPGHVADHLLDGRAICDVTGERCSVDLMSRCQLAGHSRRLVAALGIHDGDMNTLLRQRVTDALPEPAIAARHQCHRAREVHDLALLSAGFASKGAPDRKFIVLT